jgi:hypothetical protein
MPEGSVKTVVNSSRMALMKSLVRQDWTAAPVVDAVPLQRNWRPPFQDIVRAPKSHSTGPSVASHCVPRTTS